MKKLMVLLAIVLFGLMNLSVNDGGQDVTVIENYEVHRGETFWEITEHYRDRDARDMYILEYQDEVRELNPWLKERCGQIKPKDIITVKYVVRRE